MSEHLQPPSKWSKRTKHWIPNVLTQEWTFRIKSALLEPLYFSARLFWVFFWLPTNIKRIENLEWENGSLEARLLEKYEALCAPLNCNSILFWFEHHHHHHCCQHTPFAQFNHSSCTQVNQARLWKRYVFILSSQKQAKTRYLPAKIWNHYVHHQTISMT